jgi:hypothetical protein
MNRLHLHLTDGVRSQRDTIAACGETTLRDPDGTAFVLRAVRRSA